MSAPYITFEVSLYAPGAPDWKPETEAEHERIADVIEEALDAALAAAANRLAEREPGLGAIRVERS